MTDSPLLDSIDIPSLRIVPVQPSDLDEIMAIESRAYEVPWTKGHFEDCLAARYEISIVRQLDSEQIVGYWVLQVILDELHILNFCVNPDRQGEGYGKQLLHALIVAARAQGFNRLLLEVRQTNKVARGLYQSAGFETIGRRKDYYPGIEQSGQKGNRVDAIVMECLLE